MLQTAKFRHHRDNSQLQPFNIIITTDYVTHSLVFLICRAVWTQDAPQTAVPYPSSHSYKSLLHKRSCHCVYFLHFACLTIKTRELTAANATCWLSGVALSIKTIYYRSGFRQLQCENRQTFPTLAPPAVCI